jgi:hypothetical protein
VQPATTPDATVRRIALARAGTVRATHELSGRGLRLRAGNPDAVSFKLCRFPDQPQSYTPMRTILLAALTLPFVTGCDVKVDKSDPSDKTIVVPKEEKTVEKNTTIVPPAKEETKVEKNTTIVNPPAEKKETRTTIVNPPPP